MKSNDWPDYKRLRVGRKIAPVWASGENPASGKGIPSMKLCLLLALLTAVPLFGADFPDAPSAAYTPHLAGSSSNFVSANQAGYENASHRFFDRGNKTRMGILAGLIAADGISTQEILNSGGHWREMDPLARPFVSHGATGQLAASVVGYGFSIGTSYLLHKTGHHKLEKLMLDASIGVETEVVSSNLIWYSAR
jgi:hypothetical protein